MPESKLREKWMYYDWSWADRCSPFSVRLSLFVQAEISSLSHSTQGSLPPPSLIWMRKFVSLHLMSPIPLFLPLYMPQSPIWTNCQSCVNSTIKGAGSELRFSHWPRYVVMSSRGPGRKGLKRDPNTLCSVCVLVCVCVYKCGLLTLLRGGKSIYFLWKIYQS